MNIQNLQTRIEDSLASRKKLALSTLELAKHIQANRVERAELSAKIKEAVVEIRGLRKAEKLEAVAEAKALREKKAHQAAVDKKAAADKKAEAKVKKTVKEPVAA